MDLKTRLFRKPFLTLLWSILVMAMALLLGVGCTLGYATMRLLPLLDESHTTIALRTDSRIEVIQLENGVSYSVFPKYFTQEDLEFFQSLDSVQEVNFHTLTGAYIPEMTSLLGFSRYGVYKSEAYVGSNEGYNTALLTATIDAVQEPVPYEQPLNMQKLGLSQEEQGYRITVILTPRQMLSLHPEIEVSLKSMECTFWVYGQGALDFFQVGQTYLICGEYSENGPHITIHNTMVLEGGHPYGLRLFLPVG